MGHLDLEHAYIVGIGSAFPPSRYTQRQMEEAFLRHNPVEGPDRDFVRRVFSGTQIEGCNSFLSEADIFRRMDKEEYVSYIREGLLTLGIAAAEKALAGRDRSKITHIIWGTMTGCIAAPTTDIRLIRALGLSDSTKRLNVENMGCLTGYRCLGLAASIAKAEPGSQVLVVVGDIRSALGNTFLPHDPAAFNKSNVINGALFRDSCGAVVVTASSYGAIYRIDKHESYLLPDSKDTVQYEEKNDGIFLYIGKEMPTLIGKNVGTLVERLLSGTDVRARDCAMCVHTGGPRILNTVCDTLGLQDDQFATSWHVMRTYGNLSGSSNLVVLDFHHRMHPSDKRMCICLSMGPGVATEGLLLAHV